MPLLKSHRRAKAARKRNAERQRSSAPPVYVMSGPQRPPAAFPAVAGTGTRHRVKRWDPSPVTGRPYKFVPPAQVAHKPAVLIVGDSHLRSCADDIVPLRDAGGCTFGFLSAPGATADGLRQEVAGADVPAFISAVCLLAPGNNVTSSRTVVQSGDDFARLLHTLQSRVDKVFVVDFPRRLTVDPELQQLLSQEYHRRAATAGVRYYDLDEELPTQDRACWSRDGVHLSDNFGMPRLVRRLGFCAVTELFPPPPKAKVSPPPPAPRRQVRPQVVTVSPPRETVTGGVKVSPPRETFDWQLVGGHKQSRGSPEKLRQQQVPLSADFIPLSPVRFPSAFLPAEVPQRVFTTARRPSKRVAQPMQPPHPCAEPKRKAFHQVATASGCAQLEPPTVSVSAAKVEAAPSLEVSASMPVVPLPVFTGEVVATPDLEVSAVASGLPVAAVGGKVKAASVAVEFPPEVASPSGWEVVETEDGFQLQPSSPEEEPSSPTVRRSVTGSFHQGNDRFAYGGNQCMAVGLVSLAVHTVKSVFSWDSDTLDKIVVNGDKLYTSLRKEPLSKASTNHLSVPDLPKQHDVDGQHFRFEYGNDFVQGVVNVSQGRRIKTGLHKALLPALEYMFDNYDTCLLTVGSYSCSLISQNGEYALVDSHSRNAAGMPVADGTSAVVYWSCLQDMYDHVRQLAISLGARRKQFEVCGVRVTRQAPKRQRSWQYSPRETCRPLHDDSDESDAVVVTEVSYRELQFSPLSKAVAATLCQQLHVAPDSVTAPVIPPFGVLGPPCKKEKIVPDGNCFFRAVSLAVTGTQKHHRNVRHAVVKELQSNAAEYTLRTASSMATYILTSRMRYVNTWATEVEIQAAANYLGVHIYTYCNRRWLQYSCKHSNLLQKGIYLDNVSGGHYETVVCVCPPLLDSCYGLCKADGPTAKGYNLRHSAAETSSLPTAETSSLPTAETSSLPTAETSSLATAECNGNNVPTVLSNISPSKFVQKKKCLNRRTLYQQSLFRAEKKLQVIRNYHADETRRTQLKETSKQKYIERGVHRQKVKSYSILKYKTDPSHNQKVKAYSISKYKTDPAHNQQVKAYSVLKYKTDPSHNQKVKAYSISKYKTDPSHNQKVKALSKGQYKRSVSHRHKAKARSKTTYHGSTAYRRHVARVNKLKRLDMKNTLDTFHVIMTKFWNKVKDGPNFVCCVCHRLLFKHSVLQCRKSDFSKSNAVAALAETSISEQYLHTCNPDCPVPCQLHSARGTLWICKKCHSCLKNGVPPPECSRNNLSLAPIPPQLACLQILEAHLLALNLPFMKIVALPKGKQNGVYGPVTCVPANIVQTSNLLPRTDMEGSLLPVKLKRKTTYKGHYKFEYVDSMKVKRALQLLKGINVHYKDIEFNEAWINEFCEVDSDCNDGDEASAATGEDELLHDRQQHCMFQDTCLMPVDIGQETLDQSFDDILHLAPAEGNSPVRVLCDPTNEAKCFPVEFPNGRGTYHDERAYPLTLARYFNNRILHADGRFAHNVEYIFYAQYLSELQQVVSSVSIALRKGKGGAPSQTVDSNVLNDEDSLRKLLQFDDGFRFLKPIRGTPSFWQGAQRDLLACVRQLGVPTWFCSFSSADMRWQNLLNSILRQAGRTETADQLDWEDKCQLLRCNPVTAARMFDFRWHCFLREVLMSSCHPIGKIKDYFYRVEFQQRGSPHVHCLFWIENAPTLDKNTDEEVVQFIDQYVTCELPTQDETLLDTVTSVQQHSKRHSKSCKKNKTVCRFNFPKPPSAKTFISRPVSEQDGENSCTCNVDEALKSDPCACKNEGQKKNELMTKDIAVAIMTKIKQALSDENATFASAEDLFTHLDVDQATFEAAYNRVARKTQVVLKRQANEVWINQYSKPLLKCWNANIDIQYVVDAYACVVYIISYISKAEKEMGLLLGNAQREAAKEGNTSAKDALKNLGSVYLHNREVCAQEAVYRLTNMHLKECSRKVVFVPVGQNTVRMSLPLNVLKQKASSRALTDEDMWMKSSVDRYKSRPKDTTFNDMCLATFASEYRILSKNEKSVNRVKLTNDCGFVLKRTRTQPAVVRYVRFSETTNPELFYQSLLQLFLPYHRDEQLKPTGFETFEEFYRQGSVRLGDKSLHAVKAIVDRNRCQFEKDADELDDIQNSINDCVVEDAWCELCPEQELERLECIEERGETEQMLEEPVDGIPDLAINTKDAPHFEKRKNFLNKSDGLALVRSLNERQMSIFYRIRQWCLDQVNGLKPDPIRVFITGGAGTGKTHLNKALHYETTRLLSRGCRDPDDICVLLTAPTGIAAHNLNAATIHTAFSIGKDVRLPYTPLGEEKLNTLRAKYSSLQLLIIDEISMVDHKLLAYIHGRLRQIKQSGDYSPFGNVAVIAVGDFYQLPPVKGKALYLEELGVDLWSPLFKIAELKTIVRQKDPVFAELLNRARTRSKGIPMLESDVAMLKRCETGEVSSALHIFPTNRQVNEHNVKQLFESCPQYVKIDAQDYVNSKQTGKLKLISGHHSRSYDTCLDETLLLGKDARVMLLKNLDVADGLVNGVCGTVTHIVYPQDDMTRFPQTVYIKFDDARVGVQKRKRCTFAPAVELGSTGIAPQEDRVTKKGGMRRQFPLKLAWACTVHKVQGLTVDKAIVSLDRIFTAGQAYVALSRVRSLAGLVIRDFKEKVIYCKDAIKAAIENMPPFMVENITRHKFNTPTFTVFLMNVRNLTQHVSDLTLCLQHLKPDCIAVTETWLPALSSFETVKMDGYTFHNQPRTLSYSSSNPILTEIQGQLHGGVGLYSADQLACNVLQVPHANLECLVYHCTTYSILVAVIYRPPSYPMTLFKSHLGKLLDWLKPLSHTIAVMGDFNDDILKSSSIAKFMTNKGFSQFVNKPTTEHNTVIDHVYVNTTHYIVEALVLPTYFSDHEGIMCSFTANT